MMQARYSSNNNGHFGLNYEHYTHFTSPIRRYSDLLVHRAIKHILIFKQNNPRKKVYNKKEQLEKQQDLELVGQHLSNTERRADEATREVANWLKCAYLEDRVGDVFTGSISQVTSFGLFIALKDLYIEGLVHISALDNDYYHFDSIRHCLIGERTRQMYRLGQPIVVRLSRVVLEQKMIDFELVEVLPSSGLKNEKLRYEMNSKYKPKPKDKIKHKSKSKSKSKSKDKAKAKTKAKPKHKSRRKSF
jgi:ribonuclease R